MNDLKFTIDNVNKMWAKISPDGTLKLFLPQVFWLGIGLIVLGTLTLCLGIYLVLLTTKGV